MTDSTITPTRPYLARAIYQWICDNQLTPYLLVDATQPHVQVPQQHIKDGQIVLNIAPHAVAQFNMENDAIFFNARFGGVSQELYVPMAAILGIYSRENGKGLFFDPSEYDDIDLQVDAHAQKQNSTTTNEKRDKKANFRILD